VKTKLIYVIAFVLFSQMAEAQVFGVRGGVDFANMAISENGTGISSKILTGFHAGPVIEFKMQHSFFFNTGLLYASKGYLLDAGKLSDAANIMNGTAKFGYFEVPLNFAYKFPVNEKSKFFVQAGPYAGYCLTAKATTQGQTLNLFRYYDIQRFDYGVGMGAGMEFGSLVASLNYELGLANLFKYPTVDASFKNRVIQISLAYMFGRN